MKLASKVKRKVTNWEKIFTVHTAGTNLAYSAHTHTHTHTHTYTHTHTNNQINRKTGKRHRHFTQEHEWSVNFEKMSPAKVVREMQ